MPKSRAEDLRPYAWEKVQFLEDANEDSRIPDAAYRVLQKICAAYNRKEGYAECARTFIVDRVPVTIKTVQRARKLLLDQGRVFIIRKPVGRASTRYGVNWWFRGADKVRHENGGKPIFDVRFEGTLVSKPSSPEGRSPPHPPSVEGTFATTNLDTNVPSSTRRGDIMSPKPIHTPLKGDMDIPPAPGAGNGLAATPAQAVGRELLKLTIKAAFVEEHDGETLLVLAFDDQHGKEHTDEMVLDGPDGKRAEAGQQRFVELKDAMEVYEVSDAEDLVSRSAEAVLVDCEMRFVPAMPVRRADHFRAWGIIEEAAA